MAGISFELRRILQKETFGAWAHAYVFGGIVVLGPFLCSVVCMGAIALWTQKIVDLEARRIFTGATVTMFGASLVATGAVQLVLTRYLADMVYRAAHERLIGCLLPSLLLSSAYASALAAPCLISAPLSLLAKVLIWSLLMTIGALWIVMVFATAAEGHKTIVAAFFIGSGLATVSALMLARRFGLLGLLAGYTGGQFVILLLLIRHLIVEFGYPKSWDWGVLDYVGRFPSLIAIGTLQGLGVWIDKFVFWRSELGVAAGGFVTSPKYDSATFLGYLTCIPAMTHFFVRIEADFSQHFHDYFDAIFFRQSYDRIVAAATTLRRGVIHALLDIFLIQAVISFLCAVFATQILGALGLPLSEVGMYRFAILASLFLSFMQFSNVVLLYLDCRRAVLASSLAFAGANPVLSWLSLKIGYAGYGIGFAAACLIGMLASLLFLTDQLFNLEYRTFSSIPVAGQSSGRRLRARRGGLFGRYNPISTGGMHVG
jgi:uncharacterized membrane protein